MRALILLVSLLGLLGCTSLLNTDGYELENSKNEGTTDTQPQACSACTQEFCDAEGEICSQNLMCRDRQQCIDECQKGGATTSSCDAACLYNLDDIAVYTDITNCQSQNCETKCDRQCGGLAYRVDGCSKCIQNQCCSEATNCADESGCIDIYNCYFLCAAGDWGCYRDCRAFLSAENSGLIGNFENCYLNKCPIECGVGKSWACVGENKEIIQSPREASMTLRFADANGLPLEKVSTVLCSWNDELCEDELARAESTSTGVATMTYQTGSKSALPVRVEISKTGRMPAQLTFSTPLSDGPITNQIWVLPTPDELGNLAKEVGVTTIEADRGHAQVLMVDCAMFPASGLVIPVNGVEDARPFYVRNRFPDMTANRTDSSGQAAFFNLPEGTWEIEAALFGEEEVPLLKKKLTIRPGKLSFVWIWPQ